MDALLTIVGIIAIALGLHDIFHTLMHPAGRGGMCRRVLAFVWWISRVTGHRTGSAVGPIGMLLVIGLWVALQGVGWALVYLPHVPEGFTYGPGVDPARYDDLLEALSFSLVSLTTLGFGDVVPVEPWLRAIVPLEALTGFALLTAALAWFSQVYPPLGRRRALALRIEALAEARYADALGAVDAVTLSRVLDGLAADVAAARVDFAQHPEGFYFQERRLELSLARQLPYVLRVRDAASARPEASVRLSVEQLTHALEQLGEGLREEFLRAEEGAAKVFAAYAADHRHEPRA